MSKKLLQKWQATKKKYPCLTEENFYRILLLYYGINYQSKTTFPDPFTRIEVIFTPKKLTSRSILTLLKPNSPFTVVDSGSNQNKALLYKNQYLDLIDNLQITTFNLKKPEPFYFYIKEINDDLVLKLNPIQLCHFYQNPSGNLPCIFCFRNDMIGRFRNIHAEELIKTILKDEKTNDHQYLKLIDELSLITGSYKNNEEYINEVPKIIRELKKYIPKETKIVVGSHECQGKEDFLRLKKVGITHFSFSIESFFDQVRQKYMKNRKGRRKIDSLILDIQEAIDVFGEDNVIIRVVVGLGDPLNDKFKNTVKLISSLGTKKNGPLWNLNIFMPFTHYLWHRFEEKPFYSLDYLFEYCSIINQYIAPIRFLSFKISP